MSVWFAVDKAGEFMFKGLPFRDELDFWCHPGWIELPEGSIEFILGRRLTWADEPVESREVKQ